MNSRKVEISVGAFVLVGIIAICFFALKSTGGKLLATRTYVVNARFANIGGLKPGSPVHIAGVTVGQVSAVTLDLHFSAIVEMRLHRNVQVPADTMASIKTTGLIGGKIVTLLPGSDEQMLTEGGSITDTESSIDIEALISRFAFGDLNTRKEEK